MPFSRLRGQKQPLTLDQVQQLDKLLLSSHQYRDRAILWVGIDGFLRSCDLLSLRVWDVQASTGEIRTNFNIRQRKTSEGVCIALSQSAREAVHDWLIESGKTKSDYLFTRTRSGKSPLSTSALRRLVKRWAVALNLPPEQYAGHTLRRTKSSYLYSQGVRVEIIQLLLGHAGLRSTTRYLGIDQMQALSVASSCDMRLAELPQA